MCGWISHTFSARRILPNRTRNYGKSKEELMKQKPLPIGIDNFKEGK